MWFMQKLLVIPCLFSNQKVHEQEVVIVEESKKEN